MIIKSQDFISHVTDMWQQKCFEVKVVWQQNWELIFEVTDMQQPKWGDWLVTAELALMWQTCDNMIDFGGVTAEQLLIRVIHRLALLRFLFRLSFLFLSSFTELLDFLQPVYVSRTDQNSRITTIEEIKRRSQKGSNWPQIMIFPEGTCTNASCLITFKGGNFYRHFVHSSGSVFNSEMFIVHWVKQKEEYNEEGRNIANLHTSGKFQGRFRMVSIIVEL